MNHVDAVFLSHAGSVFLKFRGSGFDLGFSWSSVQPDVFVLR